MSDERPTGNVREAWVEFEHQPLNHHPGYFWRRRDGLRLGFRLAGKYYKRGTKPTLEVTPTDTASPSLLRREEFVVPLANMIEGSKLESVPAHVYVARDDVELELLTHIDGKSLATTRMDAALTAAIFHYVDEKWPLAKPREYTDSARSRPESAAARGRTKARSKK